MSNKMSNTGVYDPGDRIRRLPPIGGRIIKSALAVALCMLIYWLRTLLPIGGGLPLYSALAAIWCMQICCL